eukprot:CAMPEP_0170063422 /NCGR_PEP_ID=MMETSP0019_2-20121128/4293_1 /TAXON_ID=98059 /ORGANISM="Dinobryon sp., Strain UTEXLB2267" /LENGTH=153 /DNA_ID=CAMNT_0010269843 /DNA_START=312 /DNA_END=770 /DNA_ORIENTATION=-
MGLRRRRDRLMAVCARTAVCERGEGGSVQRRHEVEVAELLLEVSGQAVAGALAEGRLQQAGLVQSPLVAGLQRLEAVPDEALAGPEEGGQRLGLQRRPVRHAPLSQPAVGSQRGDVAAAQAEGGPQLEQAPEQRGAGGRHLAQPRRVLRDGHH